MEDDFLSYIDEVSAEFLSLARSTDKPVRIVGNLDTDGITASSVLCKAFSREGINYSISIVKQINDEVINGLKNEDCDIFVFVDLAASYVNRLNNELGKNIFILDHHLPEIKEKRVGNVRMVNPHLFEVDATKEIASAGIAYFFAKSINEINSDLSYLGLVGAIGDMQENMGFIGLNQRILEDAVNMGLVDVKESLRIFGMQTKPIHKVLENSTNPYIPGVTGSERAAMKFIEDAGIRLYDKQGKFRRLVNLSKEELGKLITAIDIKRVGGNSESMVGPVFLLNGEGESSLKKDLREFSTLLNSCGRMGFPSLGIGVCMGDEKTSKRAYSLLRSYEKEIVDALNWFYEHRRSDKVIEKNGYVIILAGSNIRDTIIGTLASLLSKSGPFPSGTVIMSTAYTLDGMIKVSLRVAGNSESRVDLRIVVKDILAENDGYWGGHKLAAGGSIPQEREDEMIRNAISVLDKEIGNKV